MDPGGGSNSTRVSRRTQSVLAEIAEADALPGWTTGAKTRFAAMLAHQTPDLEQVGEVGLDPELER